MPLNYRTYSFKDTSGAFAAPQVGVFQFAGQKGLNQFTISMTTEKTAQSVAGDGTVMISAIPGDNGQISMEMQQTSALHQFLLAWYNSLVVQMNAGNVDNWAAAAITLRNLVDGSIHELRGVSPNRIPDKTYAAQGGMITWTLMAADIQNVTLGA